LITELKTIDGVGTDKENENLLALMISDHLDWEDASGHLHMLQSKINNYLTFIETKQYESLYPGRTFTEFRFEIYFMHPIPKICVQFLEHMRAMLAEENITIETFS